MFSWDSAAIGAAVVAVPTFIALGRLRHMRRRIGSGGKSLPRKRWPRRRHHPHQQTPGMGP